MIHKPRQRPWAEFAYTAIQEENSRWYDENIGNQNMGNIIERHLKRKAIIP
jgi:hypothetical protein